MRQKAVQREADALDLEVKRLVGKLYDFASRNGATEVSPFANIVDGKRHTVRQYMSEKDRTEKPY